MASPVVLPDCVGPRTSTECLASVAISDRPDPAEDQPAPPGLRTRSLRRSPAVAHRAPPARRPARGPRTGSAGPAQAPGDSAAGRRRAGRPHAASATAEPPEHGRHHERGRDGQRGVDHRRRRQYSPTGARQQRPRRRRPGPPGIGQARRQPDQDLCDVGRRRPPASGRSGQRPASSPVAHATAPAPADHRDSGDARPAPRTGPPPAWPRPEGPAAAGRPRPGTGAHRLTAVMRASVSTSAASAGPSRCSTRNDRCPSFHSATPRGSWGSSSASVVGQADQLGRGRHLGRRLAEDDPGLGVGQQALGQALLLGAVGARGPQVREPVDDRDVGDAVGPGQLEAGLQPTGDAEVGKDGPRLVDHDQPADAVAAPQDGLQPRGGAGHQDAEGGRPVQRGQVEHDERPVESDARRRRPVEHAGQVALDQPPQLEGDLPPVGGQAGDVGVNGGRRRRIGHQQGVDDPGQGRPVRPAGGDGRHGQLGRGALAPAAAVRPRDAAASEHSSSPWRRTRRADRRRRRRRSGSSGLSRMPDPGAMRSGIGAARRGQRPVLALRVDHPGLAAEDLLAPQEGLDEARLAPPDLAEDQHVGIGQHAGAVQLPRVVAERPAEQIPADVGAPTAEAALGHERIGGLEVGRGGPVGRRRRHASPRASGSVHVNASSCWPYSRRSSRWAWDAACSTSAQAASSPARSGAETVT